MPIVPILKIASPIYGLTLLLWSIFLLGVGKIFGISKLNYPKALNTALLLLFFFIIVITGIFVGSTIKKSTSDPSMQSSFKLKKVTASIVYIVVIILFIYVSSTKIGLPSAIGFGLAPSLYFLKKFKNLFGESLFILVHIGASNGKNNTEHSVGTRALGYVNFIVLLPYILMTMFVTKIKLKN